jgi:raffinose/stachyose/melibiose transport system permease protein
MKKLGPIRGAILAIWFLIALAPTLWVVVLSLRPESAILTDAAGLPRVLSPSNYVQAWNESDAAQLFFNTILVTAGAVALVLIASALFSFAISRIRFRGSRVIYLSVVAGLAIPGQIIVLPLYLLMRDLHLVNTLWSIVLIYTATGIPFAVFLMTTFMENLPTALDEAALIDGASRLQLVRYVVAPLIRPALAIVAVFNIINDWNNFLIPLVFLQDPHEMTVSVGVFSFVGQYGTTWNLLLALLIIVSAPLVLVFIVMAEQFKKALLGGALKF